MAALTLLNAFPIEIHALILEQCPPNDRTCLRLTCKYLYNVSPPKYPVHLAVDERGPPICGAVHMIANRHNGCHEKSFQVINEKRAEEGRKPLKPKRCKAFWKQIHCDCFSKQPQLHRQLKSWMPKDYRYCRDCDIFTPRKKSQNNRCYHGQPKPSRRHGGGDRFWTHRSRRGAFGHKLWKKWFNNAAMDKMEKRLRGDRKENKRYNLRAYQPREPYLDTYSMRHGQ